MTDHSAEPNPDVMMRLYGPNRAYLDSALRTTLASLMTRRAHIDVLIAMIEAEQAMRGLAPTEGVSPNRGSDAAP